jgi:hypothetical protein
MAKKKQSKSTKNINVKMETPMPFDEAMRRIVRVKPPQDKEKKGNDIQD